MASPTVPTRPPVAPKATPSPAALSTPTHDQVVVLYTLIVFAVVIFGVWNIPGARLLITPLKLLTIGFHELCHIAAAILTGGSIMRVSIDPLVGGATIVEGGIPPVILSAGYIGSTFFGAAFVLAGFDTLVAKIMSFVIGIGLLCPIVLVRDKLTMVLIVLYEGFLIACWFIGHAQALRWYCLFVGVMNILYVIWDVADDRFFHKANDSDATQFSLLFPRTSPHAWAIFWIIFQIIVLISFAVLGIRVFKRTPEQMYEEAARFLPT